MIPQVRETTSLRPSVSHFFNSTLEKCYIFTLYLKPKPLKGANPKNPKENPP